VNHIVWDQETNDEVFVDKNNHEDCPQDLVNTVSRSGEDR